MIKLTERSLPGSVGLGARCRNQPGVLYATLGVSSSVSCVHSVHVCVRKSSN